MHKTLHCFCSAHHTARLRQPPSSKKRYARSRHFKSRAFRSFRLNGTPARPAERCDAHVCESRAPGEPVMTPLHKPFHSNACSIRCYQRIYRKRRRGQDSVVQWKRDRSNIRCIVCKSPLDKFGQQHKRKDAKILL